MSTLLACELVRPHLHGRVQCAECSNGTHEILPSDGVVCSCVCHSSRLDPTREGRHEIFRHVSAALRGVVSSGSR